ncbi:MAG: hypothetical protein GY814_08300 [Gammaproteobacteria bacterium]|nr:hypothetical protein [Gammaproteobacteria bacterium]
MDLLRKWFVQRHMEGIPTVELLEKADNDADKEAICAVAMFDIDQASMLEIMGDVTLTDNHIVHCRDRVQQEVELELFGQSCGA